MYDINVRRMAIKSTFFWSVAFFFFNPILFFHSYPRVHVLAPLSEMLKVEVMRVGVRL